MEIFDAGIYTITEASKYADIPIRTVQRLCKKNRLEMKDGRYIITGAQIKEWKQSRQKRTPNVTPRHDNATVGATQKQGTQNTKELQEQINSLQKQLQELKATKRNTTTRTVEAGTHQEKLKRAIELITIEAMEQGVTHKIFTEEEYQDVIGTLETVSYQEEQINYLRNRIEKQDEYLQKLFKTLEQRNYIEAKDKGHN